MWINGDAKYVALVFCQEKGNIDVAIRYYLIAIEVCLPLEFSCSLINLHEKQLCVYEIYIDLIFLYKIP